MRLLINHLYKNVLFQKQAYKKMFTDYTEMFIPMNIFINVYKT